MISYIHGTLLDVRDDCCTVLTGGGVGYGLRLPSPTLERLPGRGEEVAFFVHTQVKEDAIDLYGFESRRQQETFVLLLSVSKLGPRTALAILSTFDPGELADLIARQDDKGLTRVPGIGAKSAKRIIWELKDSFETEDWAPTPGPSPGGQGQGGVFSDSLAGLLNLGYSESEVRPVLGRVLQEDPDLMPQEALRQVLQEMSKQR
jgi:Holliday junction DNA helicase RuvA